MSKLLIIGLFISLITKTIHAQGTLVTKPITPANWSSIPVVNSNHIKGGVHCISNLSDTINIPDERKNEGMFCYVTSTQQFLQLINSQWKELSIIKYYNQTPTSTKEGDIIYNKSLKQYQYYNGIIWKTIAEKSTDISDSLEFKRNSNVVSGGYKMNDILIFGSKTWGTTDTSIAFDKSKVNLKIGSKNTVSNSYSSITGGIQNSIASDYGYIGGGTFNIIQNLSDYSAILGGYNNLIQQATYGTIVGGKDNKIGQYADYSLIGGLGNKTTEGTSSFVPQLIFGKYNYYFNNYSPIFSIGWGSGDDVSFRKNILELDNSGNLLISGALSIGKAKELTVDTDFYTFPNTRGTINNSALSLMNTTTGEIGWIPIAPLDAGTTPNSTLRWNGSKWIESTTLSNDNITVTLNSTASSENSLSILSNSLTTGKSLSISSTNTGTTGNLFYLSSASSGAFANGAIYLSLTGNHAGNGFQIDDNTKTGKAFQININEITSGSGLSIISTYASGNSINGLLYVANTGSTINGAIARIQSNSTVGSGLNVLANGNIGIGIANPTSSLHIKAGTAAAGTAPLKFTAGTNLSITEGGTLEYDGTNIFYTSANNEGRSVIQAEQFIALNSAYTLTSSAGTLQKLFNVPANGAYNAVVGTYFFECSFSLSSMSTLSGTFSFGFLGTGTATISASFNSISAKATAGSATAFNNIANNIAKGSGTILTTNSTKTSGRSYINGIIRVTVAGTIIPAVSTSIAANAIVQSGSYFRIVPVSSSSTITSFGGFN